MIKPLTAMTSNPWRELENDFLQTYVLFIICLRARLGTNLSNPAFLRVMLQL